MKQKVFKVGKKILLGFVIVFIALIVIGMIFGEDATLSLKQKELVLE